METAALMLRVWGYLKALPVWLRTSMLVTELLFVLIVASTLNAQLEELGRIDRQLLGAEQGSQLYQHLSLLADSSADCLLANGKVEESQTYIADCDSSRAALQDAVSTWQSTLQYLNHSGHTSTGYRLDLDRPNEQAVRILDHFFDIYTASKIQLNTDTTAFLAGRLLLVHTPELYAHLLRARNTAIDVWRLGPSFNSLLKLEGVEVGVTLQTTNSVNELVTQDSTALANAIAVQLGEITRGIDDYFNFINSRSYSVNTLLAFSRDRELIERASQLFRAITQFRADIMILFENALSQERSSVQQVLGVQLGLAVLLQLLVLFLFAAVYRSVMRDRRSAAVLGQTLQKQDKMFSIIGHELRTPAAALKMQLDELIQSGSRGPAMEELRSTSEHLLEVLDDMRVGTDQSITAEYRTDSVFSVFNLCQEVINSLNYMAGRYNVDLILNASSRSDFLSYGTKKLVRQILINLTKNAIIHAGASRIELRLQTDQASDGKTDFTIQVIDNGKGIPANQVERLFQAYERGDTVSAGSGLGLSVSRELAHSLENGALECLPGYEKGSIFKLRFTLAEYVPDAEDGDEDTAPLHGKRVLLVEDTPTLLMLGHKILSRAGAVVIDATQGDIGLELAQEQEFDLIITDIMMPVMDGYELTRSLRALGFNKPIIGVTGATVGSEAARLLESGADAVLPKPLNLENLYAALKRARPH